MGEKDQVQGEGRILKIILRRGRKSALTFLEIIVVVAVVVILLGVVVLPSRSRDSRWASRAGCASNLKEIGLAELIFAESNNDQFPLSLPFDSTVLVPYSNQLIASVQRMSSELNSNSQILVCPSDIRKPAADFKILQSSNLSYFFSLDASRKMPNAIAAGDRNLEVSGKLIVPGLFTLAPDMVLGWTPDMHSKINGQSRGNLLLSDGSVQMVVLNSAKIIRQQDLPTNHLIVP